MRGGRGWALVVAALLLTACDRDGPGTAPTPAVDVLVIVTATPGAPPAPTPTPGVARRYVVREGDTLSAIAIRFDVTEEALLRANGLTDPNRLLVGQELVIPPPEP